MEEAELTDEATASTGTDAEITRRPGAPHPADEDVARLARARDRDRSVGLGR